MPTVLAIFAGILALKGIDGWEWFLFGALVTGYSFSFKTSDDEEKAEPVKKSKFQERLENALREQQELAKKKESIQ